MARKTSLFFAKPVVKRCDVHVVAGQSQDEQRQIGRPKSGAGTPTPD